MKNYLIILFVFLSSTLSISQEYYVKGTIKDKDNLQVLSFSAVRVLNTSYGTIANINGEFELKLRKGNYKISASFIGYYSDTINIIVNGNTSGIALNLKRNKIDLPEIVIKPGENPAIPIIKKAIEKKKLRNNALNDYVYYAYTKGIMKTQQDFNTKDNSVSLGLNPGDTTKLKISGILENLSKGYYKRPSDRKDIIIARKQSSNFTSTINTLIGGRLTQSFYGEDMNFLGLDIPGPIADDAIKYYYFYLQDRLMINNELVYKIYLAPDNDANPGFMGYVYIKDKTFDLIKTDLTLNRAANYGGMLDSIYISQQFTTINDSISMPADFRIMADFNVMGLVKFGFEMNTILYNYEVNKGIDDNIFSKATVTVLPDADKKDSTFWENYISLPYTNEEVAAYNRIDSVSKIKQSFWDKFSFASTRLSINDNFSMYGPLSLYHFNKTEGNSLDFGLFADALLEKRISSSFVFNYGFADKKLKESFSAEYLLGDYRTTRFSLNVFNRLNTLFNESVNINELSSTLIALISKYDYKDYYYTKGLNLKIETEVIPILKLDAGYYNQKDNTAFVKSNVTWFYKERSFKENKLVNDLNLNYLSAGFFWDFRNYIEDGLFRRRVSDSRFNIYFKGNLFYSNNKILHTDFNFKKYESTLYGNLRTFRNNSLSFRFYGTYNDGPIPFQMLYSLPGNIDIAVQDNTFRTLKLNEYIGDRGYSAFLEYNFNNELFKLLYIPFLKDNEFVFKTYFNAALITLSDDSHKILINPIKNFNTPFFETGFSFGHILFPISVDFAWKITHRGKDNFSIGLNTILIQD